MYGLKWKAYILWHTCTLLLTSCTPPFPPFKDFTLIPFSNIRQDRFPKGPEKRGCQGSRTSENGAPGAVTNILDLKALRSAVKSSKKQSDKAPGSKATIMGCSHPSRFLLKEPDRGKEGWRIFKQLITPVASLKGLQPSQSHTVTYPSSLILAYKACYLYTGFKRQGLKAQHH